MRTIFYSSLLLLCVLLPVHAEERTIDVSGNNTSDSYRTYSDYISLSKPDTVNVKLARYVYFSSAISGDGVLNLYGGGERCYLGTEKGKAWPDWTWYSGDIHIYPFKANAPSAGYHGVLLAHGSKSSSAENALDDANSGKVNYSMANNRVTLHEGATMICEANSTTGTGIRIGELNTEVGSTLSGYYKKSRGAYYLLGGLNTDFTLAGTIKPTDYRDDTSLSIVKEGTGTLAITGNDNYVSGALRILAGRVNIMNDRAEAELKKLRGALGAMSDVSKAIAYVFVNGVLGGTGSIGGSVDNYGVIEPGTDAVGLLTLKNYAAQKDANLIMHPASELRIKVASTASFDQLSVDGEVKFNTTCEDFTSSVMVPVVEVELQQGADVKVGDEFRILTAKSKQDNWHFNVKAAKYTWEVEERKENDSVAFVLKLVSLENMGGQTNPDDPTQQESTIGAFYDDGIDDSKDNNTLRYYAAKSQKDIGVALATYKGLQSDRDAAGQQFSLMVCENEMKMDALQPSQGGFSFGSADLLVSFAKDNNMDIRGHCLVWHSQVPAWVSSDGKKNDKGWTRAEALAIMKNHIAKVMQHYKGKVREWDVVNECLDDDQTTVRSNPDSYDMRKQSVWQLAIGNDYVDSAFVYAHQADPDAVLFLNDYGVELQGKAKTAAFYNLATRLKKAGIPIDGVGLQCHFSVGDVDSVKLDNTIKRFEEAGLKCIITELDMGVPSTSEANLLEQARNYRVITDIVLNHDNCSSMVIWGIKDNDSWREASNPLLYTSGLAKKPAWYAVRSALRHRTLNETSIQPVVNVDTENVVRYNLAGQKVDADYKGIAIVKGRKVVIK